MKQVPILKPPTGNPAPDSPMPPVSYAVEPVAAKGSMPGVGSPIPELSAASYADLVAALAKDLPLDFPPASIPSLAVTGVQPVPYFNGFWVDTNVGSSVVTLPVVSSEQQKGMVLSGGGCKVPIAGLYNISVICRADNTAVAVNYSEMYTFLNGANMYVSLTDHSYDAGAVNPYRTHVIDFTAHLAPGDVITAGAYAASAVTTFFGGITWPYTGLRVTYLCPWTGRP